MADRRKLDITKFLPTTRDEMKARGWDELDVLIVTGDAYIDHPAFGAALIGRVLESQGYRVGIVAQPRWNDSTDVSRLGRPRLFAGITAGALDSMLAHYTAFRKKRHDDAFTPGGRSGARPNRASIVYTSLIKHAYPGLPVVLGGIEASMRRLSHYDFWTDSIRRSLVLDAKAELAVYGMAERAVLEIAGRIAGGLNLKGVPGTVYVGEPPEGAEVMELPSHEQIVGDSTALIDATLAVERQIQAGGPWLSQSAGGRKVMAAPPAVPLATGELDAVYGLPFTRLPHPSYRETIPAMEMISFSITTHRGCGGGCSFCSLALHQGRRIVSRSAESIIAEAASFNSIPGFKGSIPDVGGPTANMWGARCDADPAACKRSSCLTPAICPHFRDQQSQIVELLRTIAAAPGVKNLRVASGIRHDLALRYPSYIRELAASFTGGQLKLAPEHSADRVLSLMRKPGFSAFEKFLSEFENASGKAGKEQFIIPYFISAFPGCEDADMESLSAWLKKRNWRPQQVQCFIPTPGTAATAMYFAERDLKGAPIKVARTDAQRLRQHLTLTERPWRKPR